ncbi:MAG TPA: hypothetical protein VGK67_26360 [Myxococcales bacterium]|jgi:hypothetical protein
MKLHFIPDGALDTPALLLANAEPEAVRRLAEALADAELREIALHTLPGIESVGGVKLTASTAKTDLGVRAVGELHFDWEMDAEGWLGVIDLLEPFTHPCGSPRFQYLHRTRGISVIISTGESW